MKIGLLHCFSRKAKKQVTNRYIPLLADIDEILLALEQKCWSVKMSFHLR